LIEILDIILLGFMVIIALTVAILRNIFAALMVSGIFSLLSAGLFLLLDAVDVAFTEAAVGAGIATILGIGTLALTRTDMEEPRKTSGWPILIVLLTGGTLVYGTLDMPHYGDPEAPIHLHVAPRYIRDSPAEVGVPNMVTSILASYRGYDTLGETTVIFAAGISVLLLLASRRKGGTQEQET
jgi:multicomponent Na+:H+ antiporter subunit B